MSFQFTNLIGKRLIGFQECTEFSEDELEWIDGREPPVDQLILFFGDDILTAETVILQSQNREGKYSWFTNWRIVKKDIDRFLEMNETYKSIGEVVNQVTTEGLPLELLQKHDLHEILYISRYDYKHPELIDSSESKSWAAFDKELELTNRLESVDLFADPITWEKAVNGNWDDHGVPEEPYTFITIRTNTKILNLGTKYKSCCYPSSIWEFL